MRKRLSKKKQTPPNKEKLTNQLGAYCAVATVACGLINGQRLEAGTVKFISGETVSIGNPVLIDFDGAGPDAPVFSISAGTSGGQSLRIKDLVPQLGDSDGWLETSLLPGQAFGTNYPNALPSGILVSIGRNFNTVGVSGKAVLRRTNTTGSSYGNFYAGAGEHFIAVKFTKGTAVHLGWIGVDVTSISSAVVTGWAYEDSETPSEITTETFNIVPEPHVSLLGLFGLGAAGIGEYRRRREARKNR